MIKNVLIEDFMPHAHMHADGLRVGRDIYFKVDQI
jgi:hypothetical protein